MTAPAEQQFQTLDTGKERETFEGGAVRDSQEGKPRYELIPPGPLKRLAELYSRGAVKYEPHNWAKGMSTERIMASLLRHASQYRDGDRTEDHLAAVAWNAFAIMFYENTEWDDLYKWEVPEKPKTSNA